MKRIFTFMFFVCFLIPELYAQISTYESPVSFHENIAQSLAGKKAELKTMSPLNMEQILQEDAEDWKNGVPPRFGFPLKADFDMGNSGTWTVLPSGDKIWQLSIHSPGALSINLLYDKFWLPQGAKFFVFSDDKKHMLGAFTSTNNKGAKGNIQGFATGLVYGESVTLEYYQPKIVEGQGIVSVSYVIHGYQYISMPELEPRSFEGSGNCQVNVNCQEGSTWQQEKNAVALILVNGHRYCTGSLINTTCNDNRPLLLTADHCLGGWANYVKHDAISNPNIPHWSFYWHYESPGCINPGSEPPLISTVGATVVANNGNTDFALLSLMEDPINKTGVTPYYLGWDRSGNPGTGGVGIHHPSGDIKKIATYNITPPNSNCFNSNNANFWRINWQSTTNGHSVTEGGSSGSPLINNNRRVIGQLYGSGPLCANPNCFNPPNDIGNYGKFSVSWSGGGATDSRRRLSDWLHPGGGNAPDTLDGNVAASISGPDYLCSTNTFTLQNVPAGSTVTWSASPTNLFTGSTSGSGSSAPLSPYHYLTSGQATITFMIETDCGEVPVQQSFWVGKPSTPGPIILGNTAPTVGSYEMYLLTSGLPPGATSMTWWLPYCFGCTDPWSIYSGYNLHQMVAIVGDSPGYVQAMGNNTCGNGPASLLYVVPDVGGGPCNPCPFIYPNPASEELFVEWRYEETLRALDETDEYEVALYDMQGARLFSGKSTSALLRMDLAKLRNGFYYIHILHKEGLIRKQIRVER